MRKGKRMKLYDKFTGHGKRLRTVLSVLACIFCTAFSAGCGSEGEMLSELRQEKEDVPESEVSLKEDAPDADAADDKAETDGEAESAEAGTGGADAQEPVSICVHVCGAVKRPGVYEMPAGSRFYEAVETAGGFAEDACRDYLNMAAPLADGSRLEIPSVEEVREREEKQAVAADGAAGDGKSDGEYSYYTVPGDQAGVEGKGGALSGGLVNINTADIAGLCALPGVGEGRAKAIIEYREKQGGFRKKEDIMQVSGIGEKMYARMEAYLTVE